MLKSIFIQKNIAEILEIYKHRNFTYTAEEFCKKHKYKYFWRIFERIHKFPGDIETG